MRGRIRITVMMCAVLFGLFGCGGKSTKTVTSVETVTLILRGMRGTSVYEIVSKADRAELRLYREVYEQEEARRKLEKSTACDPQEIVSLMNACGVARWNGFHGKHPKNVQDGIVFRFAATVNGGQTILADGSANFPKGYHDFVRALDAMLAEGEDH